MTVRARHTRTAGVRSKPTCRGLLLALVGFCLTAAPDRSIAVSIDCDSPSDFCTGDPCVTQDPLEITVPSCVLNFGAVDLVIAKPVEVPNNGTLSLTAETVEVRGQVRGMHLSSATGDGADVSLTSTLGGIVVKKRIDVSGKVSAGTILLDAATNVDLQNKLRSQARRTGATATGGTVTILADGAITSGKKGLIDVRGKKNHTGGGQANLTAQSGIALSAQIDGRGDPGGTVTFSCPACTVSVSRNVRVEGWVDGGGGLVTGTAAALVMHTVNASGTAPSAGTISLAADTVDIRRLKARGRGVAGGTIGVVAGTANVEAVLVDGLTGGSVDIQSMVGPVTMEKIDGRAKSGAGATVAIDAAGDAVIEKRVDIRGSGGGEFRIAAGGNLDLGTKPNSKFRATDSGVIEGQAAGDLSAQGKFEAGPAGCIGLSAGGTLDTGLATFDVALSGSCP